MLFFRKNRRYSIYRSKRNYFVALFLFVFVLVLSTLPLFKANAEDAPIASVDIYSENSNYNNGDAGAWKITKSAEWTDLGKAQIKFEVKSRSLHDEDVIRDVVVVMDNSISMMGARMQQVKTDSKNLIEALLAEPDNQVALVSFNSTATIISGFTRNQSDLINAINHINVDGDTNYYDAFLKIEDVIDGYVQAPDHELIVLFLTDGYPNIQTPNEVTEYRKIKMLYPDSSILGIQYEMGEEIKQPIVKISDRQFIASINTLNNVLYRAAFGSHIYEKFNITDYINDEFWTIADENAINVSIGSADLTYDGDTPVVGWYMENTLYSGQTATMTIDVELKDDYLGIPDQLLPTNRSEEISTELESVPDETIVSTLKPILREINPVIYDPNSPSDCDVTGTVPETTGYSVFSAVQVSNNQLTCEGYDFKGWRIATHDVTIINDNEFRMPGYEVIFKAIWGKPDISKSLDGTLSGRAVATFDVGETVNMKMRALSGETVQDLFANNTTITSIIRSDTLPTSFDTTDEKNILSAPDSDIPIYGWFNDGTIYFYSDSEYIFLNEDAHFMFLSLSELVNIDGLSGLITYKTKNMMGLFAGGTIKLPNVDAVADWDTSSVTNMDGLFSSSDNYISDLSGLSNWNVSNVTNMDNILTALRNITNLDALAKWNTKNVENFSSAFGGGYSITDISALSGWNVSSATNMSGMFEVTGITNIDALANWDVSKVETMADMFDEAWQLENIDGASNWNTSNVKYMDSMFLYAEALNDISGAANWDVSNVVSAQGMFYGASSLTSIHDLTEWRLTSLKDASYMFGSSGITDLGDLDDQGRVVNGAKNWGMGNVVTMSNMFTNTSQLINIDGAANWDVSKVQDMGYMFSFAVKLNNINGASDWKTTSLTNMEWMFNETNKLTSVEGARRWDVSHVTNMGWLFDANYALPSIEPLKNWDVSNVTTLSNAFSSLNSLQSVDGLQNWNTSNVTNMYCVLDHTHSLYSIDELAGWDVSNVRNMANMFADTRIDNVDALSNWHPNSATSIAYIFKDSKNLTDISGISGWFNTDETSKMTSMEYAFYNTKITNLDALANWKTPNVTNMKYVFSNTPTLTNVDGLENWNTTKVTAVEGIFSGDTGITSVNAFEKLNRWDTTKLTNMTDAFKDVSEEVLRPTWYSEPEPDPDPEP